MKTDMLSNSSTGILPPSLVQYAGDGTQEVSEDKDLSVGRPEVTKTRHSFTRPPVNAFLLSAASSMVDINAKFLAPSNRERAERLLCKAGVTGITTAAAGFLTVAYWLTSKFYHAPSGSPESARGQSGLTAIGTDVVTSVGILGGAVATITQGLRQAFAAGSHEEIEILKHILRAFKETEQDYASTIGLPRQNVVVLRRLEHAFYRACRENAPEKVKAYLERYVWVRSIPLQKKDVAFTTQGADQRARERLDDNVEELIASVHPDDREELQSYIDRIQAGEKVVLWLYGPPGVGKTRLGKEIAQALESAHLSISGVDDEHQTLSLAAALGEEKSGNPDYYSERSIAEVIGPFCQKLIECGQTNPFVQIDELGEEMQNAENRTRIVRYMKTHQDRPWHNVSGFCAQVPNDINFIITDNRKLTLDMLPESELEAFQAFFERLCYMEMKPLTLETKTIIARETWDGAIAELQNRHNDPKPIANMRDLVLKQCLEENERLSIPGARILIKCIKAAVIDLFSKKYRRVYDAQSPGHLITENDVCRIVKNRFRGFVFVKYQKSQSESPIRTIDAGVQAELESDKLALST